MFEAYIRFVGEMATKLGNYSVSDMPALLQRTEFRGMVVDWLNSHGVPASDWLVRNLSVLPHERAMELVQTMLNLVGNM